MAGCGYVVKKNHADRTKDKLCGLVEQAGSTYCPRHTFLHNIQAAAERDKEYGRREKKRSEGIGGGMPKTRAELIARGYQYTGNKQCPCGAMVEWWRTPAQRMAPFNPMEIADSHATSHFATCPNAARFRKVS